MTKEERLLRTVEKNLHMEETTEPGAEAPDKPDGPDTHGYLTTSWEVCRFLYHSLNCRLLSIVNSMNLVFDDY